MEILDLVIHIAAWIIIGFTLVYVFSLTILGILHTRHQGQALGSQEKLIDTGWQREGSEKERQWHVFSLLPCLNEERVIGATIEALLEGQPRGTIIVVDDGSTDATAEIAERYADDGVVVVRRIAPDAQQGKGEALNAAYRHVVELVERQGLDPRACLVCVLDADGRMTSGAVSAVAQLFEEPSVGGAQLVVRIRNRDRLIARFQDMEFWAMSGMGQLGRVRTSSVSMGGNGQFTRLYALMELGDAPWTRSLTEDLDLGLRLSVLGWKTTSTPHAYVTQQAPERLRDLVKQRTRWYQGHMQSLPMITKIARSKYLPNVAALELAGYLLVPWFITLPWSIIQQYLLVRILMGDGLPLDLLSDTPVLQRVVVVALWYVLSFSPHLFWGWLYWRRSEETSVLRGIIMAHLLVPWSYLSYLAAWRAFSRILLGRNGWTKTRRVVEHHADGVPVAPAHAVAARDAAL